MIEKYKIPKEKIKVIGTIGNTLGNVADTVSYLIDHPKIIKSRRIAILTNNWQIPRAKLFFEKQPYFQKERIELVPLSAEKLLIRYSKRYLSWVKKIYSSSEMTHRLKMERKGIEDFRSGRYKSLSS